MRVRLSGSTSFTSTPWGWGRVYTSPAERERKAYSESDASEPSPSADMICRRCPMTLESLGSSRLAAVALGPKAASRKDRSEMGFCSFSFG